jgi:SAM-dependent methyltransferase
MTETTRYFPDAESSAEKARLMQQERLLTKKMGGLLPEQIDLSRYHRILDVGCASGGWVLELAFALPETEVVGLDISERMIRYAKDQARIQGLENTSFYVMDATQPLAFPDADFDLVNARTIAGFMPRAVWYAFISECRRILRPGGVIRLTECDSWGITSSAAFERLHGLTLLAMHRAGLGFSPDGGTLAITSMLGLLLRDAGFRDIQERSFTNNFSRYDEGAQGMFNDFMAYFKLALPKIAKLGVAAQEDLEMLYDQMLIEMQSERFCGNSFFLTVWGHKPPADEVPHVSQ